MSRKSNLNDTKHYLRESRKAILGRGGDISLTAGLKDFPEAIYNIPADNSLAFQEDSSIAYEKNVPAGAEEYALVKKVGGITTEEYSDRNLCICDGVYDLSNQGYLYLNFGVLEAGSYYLEFQGDMDVFYYSLAGDYHREDSFQKSITFNTDGNAECSITLRSEYYQNGEGNEYMSGTITGIMLCNDDEADKSYEPYFKGLQNNKPTGIESKSANLFDESAITSASNSSAAINPKFGVVENGYFKAIYGKYASGVLWHPFTMNLTAGTYTISADVYVSSVCPTLSVYLGLGKGNGSIKSAQVIPSAYDTWERLSGTVTLSSDGVYYLEAVGGGAKANYTALDVRFKDIQVQRGDTATEFHPFTTEPIDTIEIPKEVQDLDGFGLGIDGAYNNHIVWRNGKVFYIQMIDDELNILETPIETDITHLFTDTSPFLKVQGGGSVVYNNERKESVPSTIKYVRKVGT